jgi:hypothetical protein
MGIRGVTLTQKRQRKGKLDSWGDTLHKILWHRCACALQTIPGAGIGRPVLRVGMRSRTDRQSYGWACGAGQTDSPTGGHAEQDRQTVPRVGMRASPGVIGLRCPTQMASRWWPQMQLAVLCCGSALTALNLGVGRDRASCNMFRGAGDFEGLVSEAKWKQLVLCGMQDRTLRSLFDSHT